MPSTALAQSTPSSLSAFEPANLDQALALATRLADSNLLPAALKKRPSDVLVVMMMGRDLGLSATQALRNVHVIDGRPSLSAEMMTALCLSHPETCEYFTLVESSDAKATYRTKRRNAEPVTMSYTIEMAAKAKLTGKQNWQTNPASMLLARASSRLARAVYPDLTNGIYTQDELEDEIVVPSATVASTPSRPGAAAAARDVTPAKSKPVPAKKPTPVAEPEDAQVEEPQAAAEPEAQQEQRPEPPPPTDEQPWDGEEKAEQARDAVLAALAKATTVEAVKATMPAIQALPEVMKDQVRPHYGEALKAAKAGGAPAREPGSDG